MTYPRTRNGYVDDGSLITASNRRDRCPNCGSSNYRETISLEECKSCGLRCDYWGGGTNEVYESMMKRNHARERAMQEEEDRKQREEWERELNWRHDPSWDDEGQN
jgi:hypothetical protein